MMKDITGQKFNRWTVLRHLPEKAPRTWFACRCDCGTERAVRSDQLQRGISKSCGCWKIEVSRAQVKRLFTKHGQSNKTPAYSIWKGIRKRCRNSNSANYADYGGRGITICERWNSFENFLADMGEPPEGTSIDRINNNGNYEPSNCRWADKQTQANNARTNLLIKIGSETMSLKQWARKLDIPYHTVYQRIFRLSWPVKKALGL